MPLFHIYYITRLLPRYEFYGIVNDGTQVLLSTLGVTLTQISRIMTQERNNVTVPEILY